MYGSFLSIHFLFFFIFVCFLLFLLWAVKTQVPTPSSEYHWRNKHLLWVSQHCSFPEICFISRHTNSAIIHSPPISCGIHAFFICLVSVLLDPNVLFSLKKLNKTTSVRTLRRNFRKTYSFTEKSAINFTYFLCDFAFVWNMKLHFSPRYGTWRC
jgi:hypothetical protein